MNLHLVLYAALGMCTLLVTPISAQEISTQSFAVGVPIAVKVIAPSEPVTIQHDETDGQQVFPTQRWQVSGNPASGVNITFEVETGFVNTDAPSFVTDAKLELSVVSESGGQYSPTDTNDTTNISAGNPGAVVSVASDGPGDAEIDLTVTFLTGAFEDLRAGTYTTTLVGTISAN